MFKTLCFIFSVSLVFFSCASGGKKKFEKVYLTNTAAYTLLAPSYMEGNIDGYQTITALYDGTEYTFDAWVQADGTGISMELLSPLGLSLGSLTYTENAASLDSQAFPKSAKPEYIIADFQLVFYKAEAAAAAVDSCGLVFECASDEKGETREIRDGKDLLIIIEKSPGLIRYANRLRGYSYTIQGVF